MALRGLFEFD